MRARRCAVTRAVDRVREQRRGGKETSGHRVTEAQRKRGKEAGRHGSRVRERCCVKTRFLWLLRFAKHNGGCAWQIGAQAGLPVLLAWPFLLRLGIGFLLWFLGVDWFLIWANVAIRRIGGRSGLGASLSRAR